MSRRQELLAFIERGRLRDAVAARGLSDDAADLLVAVALRYCEPRLTRRRRRDLLAPGLGQAQEPRR